MAGDNYLMKVTLIGTLPPIKGISPYCLDLLKSISNKADIEFIGFNKIYPEFLYPGGTKVIDESYKTPNLIHTTVRNILTYYNPASWIWAGITANGEVIHAQWWSHVLAPVYIVILSISKARRKKVVITVHNVFPHEHSTKNNILNKVVLILGDRYIVHTHRNKYDLSNFCNIPEEKISVIPHGILKPLPIKGISKKEARDYLDIPMGKQVLLYFGTIRDYKGLDVLLDSMKFVVDEINDVLLVIAGKSWVDWTKYEEIIKKNNLETYIIKHLNFVLPSDIEYYFASSDVVVLPYKYFDSQSGVGALALPFKKPLIVTDYDGLTDFVKDGRVIARSCDARDLADKIMRVVTDETLLEKLSNDSYELAMKYDWGIISDMTINLYKELI